MDQLQLLDLGGNAFAGGLPAAWGAPAAFPLLVSLDLQGNALTGGAWLHESFSHPVSAIYMLQAVSAPPAACVR